jgi:hypothetical protein
MTALKLEFEVIAAAFQLGAVVHLKTKQINLESGCCDFIRSQHPILSGSGFSTLSGSGM